MAPPGKDALSKDIEMALNIDEGGLQQKDYANGKNVHDKRKGMVHRALRQIEDFYVFSLMYMHKSPLQPLIGPGIAVIEDHSFAHACYLVICLFLPISYCIINIPDVKGYVVKDVSLCNYVNDTNICGDIVVTLFINRFSLAIGSFYILMACVLSISCKRSEYIRPSLQNGFWIPKLMMIFVVSLITSSIPPGIFDTAWHYLLTLSTIPQTLFIMFWLLDLANDASVALQSKDKMKYLKDHIMYYGSIAILFGCSLGLLIYCITYNIKQRLITKFDLGFLIFQCTVLVIVSLASIIRLRSVIHLGVIASYVTLRIGFSLEYNTFAQEKRTYFLIYSAVDSIVQLAIVSYSLFRPWRPWYYSYCKTFMYGRGTKTAAPVGQSRENDNRGSQSKARRQEVADDVTASGTEAGSAHFEGTKREPIYHESEILRQQMLGRGDIENDDRYCELKKSKNQQMSEIGKKSITAVGHERATQRQTNYEYHFVHVILAFTVLVLNGNFAKFNLITESETKYNLRDSLLTSVIVGLSSIGITVLYAWVKIICRTDHRTEELSATTLLTNLVTSLKNFFVAIMIQAPACAQKPQHSKYLYAGMLTLFIAIACLAVNPAVKSLLTGYSLFCDVHSHQGACLSTDPSLVALFRISISATLYFFILSLVLIRVESLADFRSKLQTGLWPSKILLFGLVFVIALYIPIQVGNFWIYVSLAATLLIIMLQTIFVLDATSQVLACLSVPESPSNSRRIFFSCSTIAVFLYTTAITAFFCFYVYFAQFSSCKANRLFIFINLGLCITACLISLHPAVQEGGLVKSAIITSFCMYCTWSALYNNPRQDCNPLANEMLETDLKPTKSVLFALDIAAFFATFVYVTINISRIQTFLQQFTLVCCQLRYFRSENWRKTQQLALATSKFSFEKALLGKKIVNIERIDKEACIKPGPNKKHDEINDADSNQTALDEKREIAERENKDANLLTDAENQTPYSFSLLHFIYGLLMLYFSLLLITWVDERPGSHMKVSVHWAIMCVRMMASCCCVLVYMWNLVVHLVIHSYSERV